MPHASGKFEIADWKEASLQEEPDGRKVTHVTVNRSFDGGFKGKSATDYLMAYRSDKTADYVGIERIEGELDGKIGGFVLKLTGRFDGKIAAGDWEVVEGSGDGDFTEVSGGGSFSAGHGAVGDYRFDLTF
jgi:hypothetical protein